MFIHNWVSERKVFLGLLWKQVEFDSEMEREKELMDGDKTKLLV